VEFLLAWHGSAGGEKSRQSPPPPSQESWTGAPAETLAVPTLTKTHHLPVFATQWVRSSTLPTRGSSRPQSHSPRHVDDAPAHPYPPASTPRTNYLSTLTSPEGRHRHGLCRVPRGVQVHVYGGGGRLKHLWPRTLDPSTSEGGINPSLSPSM